jgi:transposase InsO family protein
MTVTRLPIAALACSLGAVQDRGHPSTRPLPKPGGRGVRHPRMVDWFNNRRLLEPIGNIPPAEAEAAYYVQLEATPMAA